jgi:hypothetical protein
LSLQLFGERAAPLRADVDEADPGALGHERTDDFGTDAGGDENRCLVQARNDAKGHGTLGTSFPASPLRLDQLKVQLSCQR